MKRLRAALALGVFLVMGLLVLLTQSGCEEAQGLAGLQVAPPSVTLVTNNTSVVLTVVGGVTNTMLALPLHWEVSNAGLGQITAASGVTAVYRRSGAATGVNTVTVRDQFDKEGYVTITQRAASYNFSLVAEPTSLQPNQGATIRIEGDAAQAPFSWRLVAGPGSLSGDSGSRSASYAAGASTGVAQISVTDANGISASISITVALPAADDDGGTGDGTGGGDDGGDPSTGI